MRENYKHSKETIEKIRKSNLGKKKSIETRIKIGLASKGRKISESHKQALIKSNIGRVKSDEEKRKIGIGNSIALKGRTPKSAFKKGFTPWNKGLTKEDERVKKNIKNWTMKGRTMPKEIREKQSEIMKRLIHEDNNYKNKGLFKVGQKPWNYYDGKSQERNYSINGDDWDAIRNLILCRDEFRCQHCGKTDGRLHIHHKVPFMMSFDNSLNNLITLCPSCHTKEDMRILRERKKDG